MTIDQLKAQAAAQMARHNSTPLADFCGLNPQQMAAMGHEPLGNKESPVQLQPQLPDAVLDQVPLLRLTEALLRLVQREGSSKLTAGGALPRKFLLELYEQRILPEDYIEEGIVKLNREMDSAALHLTHINTTLAGLVKKVHNKLTLTKKAETLQQPGQRPALFRLILETFTQKFNWCYFDAFHNAELTTGQSLWAYSIYLLARFGDEERPMDFYAQKYQRAFPFLMPSYQEVAYMTREEQLASHYNNRTFFRFGTWFGLVKIKPQQYLPVAEPATVQATELLPQLFRVWAPTEKIL